jgi:hypothetical protein
MNIILMTVLLALTPSNMELAEEALVLSCEPLSDSLKAYNVQILSIEVLGEHGGGWFVEQTLTSVLVDNEIMIIDSVSRDDSVTSLYRLQVRPMELAVEYGDVSRPWVIGAKRIERLARSELSAILLDSNNSVIMTARASGIVEDIISWSDAGALSGSTEWEWLSGDLPEGESAGILEPLIVSGVVASLVYLFYSSRAN